MALYVSVCLLAALIALPETGGAHDHVIRIIWGVTIGLAAAHWFAFRLSARLVGRGSMGLEDVESAGAQLAAAAAVALLASIPVFLFSASAELAVVELLLAAFIGSVGFAVARGAGATPAKALLYALIVISLALLIAGLKNGLAGH